MSNSAKVMQVSGLGVVKGDTRILAHSSNYFTLDIPHKIYRDLMYCNTHLMLRPAGVFLISMIGCICKICCANIFISDPLWSPTTVQGVRLHFQDLP